MYIKHRVQNFWKYFILNREELEHALRENDHHEITHLLQDLNEHLDVYKRQVQMIIC